MSFVELKKMLLTCLRCGHAWIPRGISVKDGKIEIRSCPKCKSPYWDKPKK